MSEKIVSKAKLFIEIEIDIDKSNPNDKDLSFLDIAQYASEGIVHGITESFKNSSRKTKLTRARYEFLVNKNICG